MSRMDNRRRAWTAPDISRTALINVITRPKEISNVPAHTLQSCRLPTRLSDPAAAETLRSIHK